MKGGLLEDIEDNHMISFQPRTIDGYQLLHQGIQALANAEHNGIRIDTDYVTKQQKHLKRRIKHLKKTIANHKEIKVWKKKYGKKFNIDSNDQFADILFNHCGHKAKILTEKGNPSVSQEALEQIESPIVEDIIKLRRWQKAQETYLGNYVKETVDGRLHPFFHLHTVRTFRSSSSRINFQNQPTRIPEIKKLVRRAIIPRLGHMLVEIDYSGIEVRMAAVYHKDKRMIKDIIDPTKDMHRDMAKMCYLLGDDEWTKNTRYCAKNKFVFPQFYGDYYKNCAEALWMAIHVLNLETQNRIPLKKHLKKHGIRSYEAFEKHIREVEDYFWNERYTTYRDWKEEHYKEYLQNGYVDLKTGFRCSGLMSKNDAINYPIQGSAFHCLLWSFIQSDNYCQTELNRTKMIGQIHDAANSDVHMFEFNDFMDTAFDIMENKVRLHWPWINVPLDVEAEVTGLDQSWYTKKPVTRLLCECGSKWVWEKGKKEYHECPICGARQ